MNESRVLRRGARGDDVAGLQRTLVEVGFDPGPADGIFGQRTERAVREFQESQGLAVDGIVGPATWGVLVEEGGGGGFEEMGTSKAPPREEFDCAGLAETVRIEFMRDFPPQPVPEVEETEIHYEYLNRMNAYRDVLYAYLRGRPEEIPVYAAQVETTPTQTGRPGSAEGIANAEAVWAGLSAEHRTQLEAHRHCEIVFSWQFGGEMLSSAITVRNYIVLRLDNAIGITHSRMMDAPGIAPHLYRLQLYARSGNLELYRPVTYIAYPGSA